MKKLKSKKWMIAVAIVLIAGMWSCSKTDDVVSELDDAAQLKVDITSQTDFDGLLYMREEEKLARDVYVVFYGLYNLPVFDHISKSEDYHSNQVLALINFYGLTDPALPDPGMFSNPELQALYNELIVAGQDSLMAALRVGATIEEVDIIDLQTYIGLTQSDTIKTLYTNLMRASGYHLKAMVAQMAFRGELYSPQFLTQEQFDEIINGQLPTGGGCFDSLTYTITETEAADLLYVREEEKLAHDVYLNLFDLYNLPVFEFIAQSEQIHTTRILALLNFFDLEDPASTVVGEFNDPSLQTLYNDLLSQGSESLIAGLLVGATIEEVDIVDLHEKIESATNPSVIMVYGHLLEGSKAHLRAFVGQLSLNGVTYEPQFLSQEEFDSIIAGS